MTVEGTVAEIATPDVMILRVAELALRLDARGAGLHLVVPPAHAKFVPQETAEAAETSAVSRELMLLLRNGPPAEARAGLTPLCLAEVWELWLDGAGRYVFVAPRQSPPRWIVVDPGFTVGEVLGDFAASDGDGLYPLQSLDIRLFANWLGSYGDVILHAAGVVVGGAGFAFAGPAGVGKSTLAAFLSTNSSVTVLGEDQVILRYLEGRFWIYGTPWHTDPAFCSPLGVPLEKLFFLERTDGNGVAPCPPLDGVARLLQTAFIPYYRPAAVSTILDRLALLAQQVPFHTLSYRLGTDVMELVRVA